jgi:hypothetical protein
MHLSALDSEVIAQGKRRRRNRLPRTSRMCGVPSVRESRARSPRPPRLSLCGIPLVRDHGHDCLRPRDFLCAVTAHGELQRVMVPPGAPNIATSRVNHRPPRVRRTAPPLQNPNVQSSERLHWEGCWSHPRVHSLSQDGPWDHCWYPKDRIPLRTSSKSKMKDKTGAHARVPRSSHLLAQGSSGAATCLIASAPSTRAHDSSGAATCPVAPAPTPGTGQLWDCRMRRGSSSRHQGPR